MEGYVNGIITDLTTLTKILLILPMAKAILFLKMQFFKN